MILEDDNLWEKPSLEELMHYGVKRRSGRYPWGSGKDNYQHGAIDWYGRVQKLRDSGFEFTDEDGKTWKGDNAIAKSMGLSSTEFRTAYSIAKNERRGYMVETATRLRDKEGLNPTEIGKKMGLNESSVRSLLNSESEARMSQAKNTAEFLKKQIETKGMLDVGQGVEKELGISRTKLDEAITMLQFEGYGVYGGSAPQVNRAGQKTNLFVIGPKDMEAKDAFDYKNIHQITDYSVENNGNGDKFVKFEYPSSMDSKRLKIRYAEQGGEERDGTIELRRGCKDLDLGDANYAQVRILVDGTHYLKGMAFYNDDLPDGVDVVFNTNKKEGTPALGDKNSSVLKPIKSDPANPFGSLIKEKGGQYHYIDDDGNEKLGLINKRSEEGDWSDWADKLPSQFLAKQNKDLIQRQIKITKDEAKAEYDAICALENPTVKKKFLKDFADSCDGASADLKLAALPRQKYKVILPVDTLKDDEVYAPTYENGEKLALIRYPHGGTFEIPILTVNNKQKDGKKIIGPDSKDAIGINKRVADQLSGADFDGDTVVCIPTAGNGKNLGVSITGRKQLEDLKGFDTKMAYGGKAVVGEDGKTHYYRGDIEYTPMAKANVQREMGTVSNLITDMTIRGADDKELARAVKHSMVVIDAEKHKLDYKQSYKDNNIAELKEKYQYHVDADGKEHYGGASTLFSQAGADVDVTKRVGSVKYDADTGKKVYKEVHEEFIDNKTGKVRERTVKSKKMYETDDAHTLSSGTVKEELYADYANYMKSLANSARKEYMATKDTPRSKEAATTYSTEVESLKAKLNTAELNKPRERAAQVKANAAIKERKKYYEDSDMSSTEIKKELKKVGQQELTKARAEVGARKSNIDITDKEWEAIQAGAVSPSTLKSILDNADMDVVRQKAMPKESKTITKSDVSRIKAYESKGYTIDEIAKALGISTSTVEDYV